VQAEWPQVRARLEQMLKMDGTTAAEQHVHTSERAESPA